MGATGRTSPKTIVSAAFAVVAVVAFAGASSASAAYREPALTVPTAALEAEFHCPWAIKGKGGPQPILLVTGTGVKGADAFLLGSGPLHRLAKPVCYVDFPYRTTGDIQSSVEYLVHAVRRMYTLSGRRIAIFGVSQGGLLPRWALTYWPSLRSKVTDVVTVAATHHGSNILGPCSVLVPCIPAEWQQMAGSKLLAAINRQPDESPGPASWTAVRTLTDEVVQPQTGSKPTSSLSGATNIAIQDICPGRKVAHVTSALDSVTFAAFIDALRYSGPARVSRLPSTVCGSPFAPGAPAWLSRRTASLAAAPQVEAPKVTAEPALRSYARLTVPR